MMNKILLWLHANKVAFFILVVAFGAAIGSCMGLLAYGAMLLIEPNATEKQMKAILPFFTIGGIGIGLYFLLADFLHKRRQDS